MIQKDIKNFYISYLYYYILVVILTQELNKKFLNIQSAQKQKLV